MKTQIYLTKTINDEVAQNENFAKEIAKALNRFSSKDWGELCEEDKELNAEALLNGSRLFASYDTTNGKVYIITEAVPSRNITTILFAEEY